MIDPLDPRVRNVHQIRGAPATILMTFMLFAEQPLTQADVKTISGYSRPTVSESLQLLSGLGLVQKLGTRWALSIRYKQAMLGQVPELPEGEHIDADECKNFLHPSSSSSIILDPETEDPTTSSDVKTFYMPAPDPPPEPEPAEPEPAEPDPAILTKLRSVGVYLGPARELACDPWVTMSRIERWVMLLEGDPTVLTVAGLLTTHLRNHEEPRLPNAIGNDRRRFIQGEFADWIVS